MEGLLKLLLRLVGVAVILYGLYLGLWVMFVGGIVAIIEILQSDAVVAKDIALNILRVLLFEVPIGLGWLIGIMIIGTTSFSSTVRRGLRRGGF